MPLHSQVTALGLPSHYISLSNLSPVLREQDNRDWSWKGMSCRTFPPVVLLGKTASSVPSTGWRTMCMAPPVHFEEASTCPHFSASRAVVQCIAGQRAAALRSITGSPGRAKLLSNSSMEIPQALGIDRGEDEVPSTIASSQSVRSLISALMSRLKEV